MDQDKQPRREAGVLAEDELTTDQKRAICNIIGFLRSIARSPLPPKPTDPWSRFIPRVDEERRNHVFLIEGRRGSGKSAVLLTLIQVLYERREHPKPPTVYGAGIEPHTVIPIGLIDLQPLDDSTNLLVHLVSQIRPLVEVLKEQLGGVAPRPENLWSETAELASERTWRRFLRAASTSWGGGADRYQQGLSLEERAFEIGDTERQRLDLLGTFRDVIDALGEDYAKWRRLPPGSSPPLFLICVDDADMNPRRSRELLDLVRTLWHPRLAYVLTGHRELFLETLRVKLQSELQGAEGNPAKNVIERLAYDVYDKIIPGPHHLILQPLTLRTRLRVFQEALKNTPSPPTSALGQLFRCFEDDENTIEAIPDRLRDIHDLAGRLANSRDKNAAGLLYEFLSDPVSRESPWCITYSTRYLRRRCST